MIVANCNAIAGFDADFALSERRDFVFQDNLLWYCVRFVYCIRERAKLLRFKSQEFRGLVAFAHLRMLVFDKIERAQRLDNVSVRVERDEIVFLEQRIHHKRRKS